MIGRWCQSCGVYSDRSPSCRGLPQGRMHGTRTLHVQASYTRPYLGESGRSRARARDRAWSKGVGGDSCVRSPAGVVDGKTSVTGASRVTRQFFFFHHCENRRCRVTQCSSDSNCGGSSAQLQAGQFSHVGTPCMCSEQPEIVPTADFSPGDIIFDCNVLTIATLLPEHTKQLLT